MVEPNPVRKKFQTAAERKNQKVQKIDSGLTDESGNPVELWCRVLTAGQYSKLCARCDDKKHGKSVIGNYAAEYLSLCLCDEKGELLFPGEFGVVDLSNLDFPVLDPIFGQARKINSVSRADKKNLEGTDDGDSSTDSPTSSAEPSKN